MFAIEMRKLLLTHSSTAKQEEPVKGGQAWQLPKIKCNIKLEVSFVMKK